MESKIRYLEMIQGIINRMASNSLMLKGWAVTLVAGVSAIVGEKSGCPYFLARSLPVIMFWGLDSFYLRQERLYRLLYNDATAKLETEIDFSLNARSNAKSQNTKESKKCSYIKCLFSFTEILFYGVLMFVCIGIQVFIYIS